MEFRFLSSFSEKDVQELRRHQVIHTCFKYENGAFVSYEAPRVIDWNSDHVQGFVQKQIAILKKGGTIIGVYDSDKLKGLASVDGTPLGSRGQYLSLESLHVSEELRGQGIGRQLVEHAKNWAREHGAEKLYISAAPPIETMQFYLSVGCVPAEEIDASHVQNMPQDCQLELML